jgi:hypothetical protein
MPPQDDFFTAVVERVQIAHFDVLSGRKGLETGNKNSVASGDF